MDKNYNPTLDSPAMVKALVFVRDLKTRYRVMPKECDYQQAETLFEEGKAAMIINGPWSCGGYIAARIDIGLTPIPKMRAIWESTRPSYQDV